MAHRRKPRPVTSCFADEPEMRALVREFAGELPRRVSAIHDAWMGREFGTLRREVQRLKGASCGYGFRSIGEAAGDMESSLAGLRRADGPGWERLKRQMDELTDLCRCATEGLER